MRLRGTDLLPLSERAMSRLRGDVMGMIFQEPMTSLNPAYTVGSQMAEVLRRHRGASRQAGAGPRGAICSAESASPPRACGWRNIRTSSPAACASG